MTAEWKEARYGTHRLLLTRTLALEVFYDAARPKDSKELPYLATVFGARLKKRAASTDEAKALAMRAARQQLQEALANLPEDGS